MNHWFYVSPAIWSHVHLYKQHLYNNSLQSTALQQNKPPSVALSFEHDDQLTHNQII